MSSAASFTWVFGYGSIMWRPAFPFIGSQRAHVRGWQRRFWQASPDHRGTPEQPGRVVTLVQESTAICHGLAFEIEPRQRASILEYLDDRESGGYIRIFVKMSLEDGRSVSALTYFAPPNNANYLGPSGLSELAEQVRGATGASGRNTEYVLRLAEALREYDIDDDGVFDLERMLQTELTPPSTKR